MKEEKKEKNTIATYLSDEELSTLDKLRARIILKTGKNITRSKILKDAILEKCKKIN